MITLHILKYLEDNSFGVIDISLFFEKLPLGKNGVAIYSRGGEQAYGRSTATQSFDLYSRGTTDVTGMKMLEDIRTFLADSYGEVCDLPEVPPYSNIQYEKVRFVTIDNIENIGLDENDRVVYRLGAQVIYQKN